MSAQKLYVVTQIKKQVDQAHQLNSKLYSLNRQKRELKYYSLHLKSISRIQRYFRSYLLRKTKALQADIICQIKRKQKYFEQQKRLEQDLASAKVMNEKLQNISLSKMVQNQKQNLNENARQIVRNVVDCADKYAKNVALSKISMGELSNLINQQKQLRAQIKQLQLERQCYQQRMETWNQKLKQLRQKIMIQSSQKNKYQRSNQ